MLQGQSRELTCWVLDNNAAGAVKVCMNIKVTYKPHRHIVTLCEVHQSPTNHRGTLSHSTKYEGRLQNHTGTPSHSMKYEGHLQTTQAQSHIL